MENTIENAKIWVKENESNYPNVFKSKHWTAQMLFDYAQQVKKLNIPAVIKRRELLIDFQAHRQDCDDDHLVRYDLKADKYLKLSINSL